MTPKIYVHTPIHDGRVYSAYMAGCVKATREFGDRIRFENVQGSFLPRNRDILTAHFYRDTDCTHMLCVDSDIGWKPADLQAMLDTGRDVVSGRYAKKETSRGVPGTVLQGGETTADLVELSSAPAGFLLVSREAIARMVTAYPELEYRGPFGRCWALWAMSFEPGVEYCAEDTAFCRRWTRIGGRIFRHMGVTVQHVGDHVYLPAE